MAKIYEQFGLDFKPFYKRVKEVIQKRQPDYSNDTWVKWDELYQLLDDKINGRTN